MRRLSKQVGDIDGSTAPVLQDQILAVAQPGCRLLLDMTQVSYMSSAGLRVMLLLHRQISGGKGKVVLVGLSEDITRYDVCDGLPEILHNRRYR